VARDHIGVWGCDRQDSGEIVAICLFVTILVVIPTSSQQQQQQTTPTTTTKTEKQRQA
jgi:hypothetical protein